MICPVFFSLFISRSFLSIPQRPWECWCFGFPFLASGDDGEGTLGFKILMGNFLKKAGSKSDFLSDFTLPIEELFYSLKTFFSLEGVF